MAATTSKSTKLDSSLKHLTISPSKSRNSASKSKHTQPSDSWEDDASSSSSPTTPTQDSTIPNPPPPTPISPTHHHRRERSTDWLGASSSSPPSQRNTPYGAGHDLEQERLGYGQRRGECEAAKRPEKSSATASRMIAGALGVKGQKMGEEQRRYERAVREKERKRLDGEKEEEGRREREKEEARRAVWND